MLSVVKVYVQMMKLEMNVINPLEMANTIVCFEPVLQITMHIVPIKILISNGLNELNQVVNFYYMKRFFSSA